MSAIGSERKVVFIPEYSRLPVAASLFGDSDERRKLLRLLALLLALGLSLAFLNLSWPLARNALDYAKAALEVIAHHFNLYAVAQDGELTGGKPILFSVLAAPLVWFTNARIGTIAASALGTSFFLWTVTLALPRLSRRSSLLKGHEPLALILTTVNPLAIYQFWSGYPDSLFAGLIVLAFVLTDIVASEPGLDTRWHIIALGVTILAAIHTKLYGAVLCLTCPVYLLQHVRRNSRGSVHTGSKLLLLGAVFGLIALLVIGTKLSIYPFLVLGTGSGFNDYLASTRLQDLARALVLIGVAMALAFQFSLLFLFSRDVLRTWPIAPTVFVGIFLIGLLPASGITYNMRYLLPIFPFVAAALAAGAGSIGVRARRAILGLYGVAAILLVANFNVAWVEEAIHPAVDRVFPGFSNSDGLLDNLRLPVHIALKRQIDTINRKVPDGSILYWSSDYYGTATHGLAPQLGVKNGLNVRYVLEPSEPSFGAQSVYLTEFTSYEPSEKLWQAPPWATTKALGNGVFRLDPIRIELNSLSGDSVPKEDLIRVRAQLHVGANIKFGSISFRDNAEAIAAEPGQPLELRITHPMPGRHEITAQVSYSELESATADPLVIYVGVPALERAARSADSMLMEGRSGEVAEAQNVLWLASSQYSEGIRFKDIAVPSARRITRAFLTFSASGPTLGSTILDITAELSPNPAPLTLRERDLSKREPTRSHVMWNLEPWTDSGQQSHSPNLAPLLQEVTAQTGWRPGNAVVLLIHVAGAERQPQATDDNGGHGAPRLYVEYEP